MKKGECRMTTTSFPVIQIEKTGKPKVKKEEKELMEEQNQAEQPQDIQSV